MLSSDALLVLHNTVWELTPLFKDYNIFGTTLQIIYLCVMLSSENSITHGAAYTVWETTYITFQSLQHVGNNT